MTSPQEVDDSIEKIFAVLNAHAAAESDNQPQVNVTPSTTTRVDPSILTTTAAASNTPKPTQSNSLVETASGSTATAVPSPLVLVSEPSSNVTATPSSSSNDQMSDMTHDLTVLMSCYNTAANYLTEAIESILKQTHTSFEFLIIDDGNTPETKQLLKQFSEQDKRICLVTNPSNLGLTASLNRGLQVATGSLIARMDADDIALPDRLQKQYEFMQQHPEIGVLGTAVEIFHSSTESSSTASSSTEVTPTPSKPPRVIRHPCTSGMVEWSLPFYCCLAHPTVMFRRDVILKAGGYRAGWSHAEDYELWLRLSRQGIKMANLPDVLLRLRKHGSNISSASSTAAIQQHHTHLALQHHLSELLEAPVGLEYARGLMKPSSLPHSIGDLCTISHLMRALEARLLKLVNEEDAQAIQRNCTARLGELVTLTMQSGSSPLVNPSLLDLTIKLPPNDAILNTFSLTTLVHSSQTLMSSWMSRGGDARALMAKLLMNK